MAEHGMFKLKALALGKLPAGKHADGGGLYLHVSKGGARSWLFRSRRAGRAQEMGLGSLNAVSLERARQKAAEHRAGMAEGGNPLAEKRQAALAARIEAAKLVTFGAAAEAYIRSHRAGWGSPKSEISWRHTLDAFALPVLGKLPVGTIDTGLVTQVIEPIWQSTPETANRLRGRLEMILDYAKVRGWRDGDNPARWRGHLDHLLPERQKVAKTVHHPALDYADLPAFMGELRSRDGMAARALEFLILTATRTGETTGVTWQEIDLEARQWTIPAERMKAGREHRVPLSEAAMAILAALPGERAGKVFGGSNMAMAMLLRRMGRGEITVHGFRATFSTWAAEKGVDHDLKEMALAHVVGSAVARAYDRSDKFDLRHDLMDRWARFCNGDGTAKVVRLRPAAG